MNGHQNQSIPFINVINWKRRLHRPADISFCHNITFRRQRRIFFFCVFRRPSCHIGQGQPPHGRRESGKKSETNIRIFRQLVGIRNYLSFAGISFRLPVFFFFGGCRFHYFGKEAVALEEISVRCGDMDIEM